MQRVERRGRRGRRGRGGTEGWTATGRAYQSKPYTTGIHLTIINYYIYELKYKIFTLKKNI